MDPQNQGSRFETPSSGPAYPPQAYAPQPVAGAQPDIVKRAIAVVIDFVLIGVAVGRCDHLLSSRTASRIRGYRSLRTA